MTSYSGMAARGREASLATTTGRRKVVAERIEYTFPERENVTALPGATLPAYRTAEARLIGSCGHTLRWLAAVPVVDGEPCPSYYLTGKVGRRMTCPHDDCKIAPKPVREEREDDCTWLVGTEGNERRCRTRAKWDTDHGALCTRHRDHLLREGYLDEPGTEIAR